MSEYKCIKCGSPVRFMGMIQISIPSKMMNNLSKKDFRDKNLIILGANWETFDAICTNQKCRHVKNAYGNYVTRLQQRLAAQKKATDALLDFSQSVAGGSGWWYDVWPNIEKELEAVRQEVKGE